MTPNDADLPDDVLNGRFVRDLRFEALSLLSNAAAARYSNPVVAEAFMYSALRLKARADEIERLTETYLRLGLEVMFWTLVVESPDEYVQMITGINPQ